MDALTLGETMKASLVYDGTGNPITPISMGSPTPEQLQGTPLERLGELASRICYDSLGAGRSSAALHKHILEVINLSVYEHLTFTLQIAHAGQSQLFDLIIACANRKGIWIEWDDDTFSVTANFRAILEWDKKTSPQQNGFNSELLKALLEYHASVLAPQIVPQEPFPYGISRDRVKLVHIDQMSENQAHITLYLSGSRGFTHEQVRHRFAMSQRSTRYVDETDSDYVQHPLITKILNDKDVDSSIKWNINNAISKAIGQDREAYSMLVEVLTDYNIKRGLDKTSARKQARGAARGNLGNALESEMLFTAPVSGWKIILGQRLNKFADAEIRDVYADALPALKRSVFGHFFSEYNTVASPDGIGVVIGS